MGFEEGQLRNKYLKIAAVLSRRKNCSYGSIHSKIRSSLAQKNSVQIVSEHFIEMEVYDELHADHHTEK